MFVETFEIHARHPGAATEQAHERLERASCPPFLASRYHDGEHNETRRHNGGFDSDTRVRQQKRKRDAQGEDSAVNAAATERQRGLRPQGDDTETDQDRACPPRP